VLRACCIAEARSPHIQGKKQSKKAEEEAGDFEPENSSDPAKWTQKTAYSAACGSGKFVRCLTGFTDFFGVIDGVTRRLHLLGVRISDCSGGTG